MLVANESRNLAKSYKVKIKLLDRKRLRQRLKKINKKNLVVKCKKIMKFCVKEMLLQLT